jgi:hypothetical protein
MHFMFGCDRFIDRPDAEFSGGSIDSFGLNGRRACGLSCDFGIHIAFYLRFD